MTNSKGGLLTELSEILSDYRLGEIPVRTPEMIDAWLQQFPVGAQDVVLSETVHAFRKTYISRRRFKAFLAMLASTRKLSPGSEPRDYWRTVGFLDIQRGGDSQKEILAMFDELLKETYGFGVADSNATSGEFIYLDDCVGTGSRVRADLCGWIETSAPVNARIHIVTPALYQGAYWIDEKIQAAARESKKEIVVSKWRLDDLELENRKAMRTRADVLWPTEIPDDPDVASYARYLEANGHPFELRTPGNAGAGGLFSSDTQKIAMERAFLIRGCQIRRECESLPERARPLGYQNLDSFGFGSMVVTFRNCPNNCPLAFWVDQKGCQTLLPRKTNAQVADQRWMQGFLR